MKLFKNLYDYRELLKTNVKKDIRGKYKGSFLGVLWSFLNPLLMVAVYAIVFPYIMRIKTDNYLQYLICGVIPWNFFTTVMGLGMGSIKNNAGVIKKVYFPREILPISATLSGLVNFFIACLIIILFCVFGGLGLSWHILLVPFIALIQFVITAGMVLGLSAINVYIQDTEYIIQFVINMLFYATPIVYSPGQIPESFQWIIQYNPMTYIINGYRNIFYYKQAPDFVALGGVFAISIVLCILGYFIFHKLQKRFAEEM